MQCMIFLNPTLNVKGIQKREHNKETKPEQRLAVSDNKLLPCPKHKHAHAQNNNYEKMFRKKF